MLLPMDEDAKQLIAWMEHGVCDALKRGYLQALRFGISKNGDASQVLEEFELVFKYCESGDCKFDFRHTETGSPITQHHGGVARPPNQAAGDTSLDTVKQQVAAIIRKLIVTCTTLGPLPAERCVFMKLVYTDSCPDSYQPTHFRDFNPTETDQPGALGGAGINVSLGSFQTQHHLMSLGVSSLLDQFPASQEYSAIADSEIAEPPPFQDRSSQQHRGGTLEQRETLPSQTKETPPAAATQRSACVSPQASEVTRDTIMDSYVDQVEEFCARQQGQYQSVSIARLVQAFPEIPESALEIAVGVLCEWGLLQPGGHPCEFLFVGDTKTDSMLDNADISNGNELRGVHGQVAVTPVQQPFRSETNSIVPAAAEEDSPTQAMGKSTCGSSLEDPGRDATVSPIPLAHNQLIEIQYPPVAQQQYICTESLDLAELLAQHQVSDDRGKTRICDDTDMGEAAVADGVSGVPADDSQATVLNSQLPPLHADAIGISDHPRGKKRAKTSVVEIPIVQPKRACIRSASQPQPRTRCERTDDESQEGTGEDNDTPGQRTSSPAGTVSASAIITGGGGHEKLGRGARQKIKPRNFPLFADGENAAPKVNRGRGRPPKPRPEGVLDAVPKVKRGRGRPRKIRPQDERPALPKVKRGRGRPRKIQSQETTTRNDATQMGSGIENRCETEETKDTQDGVAT